MSAVDLALDDLGDLELTAKRRDFVWISGVPAIAQLAANRLRLIKNEWSLDTAQGLDWERIMGVGVTAAQVEDEVRRVLASVPGVSLIVSVDATIDSGRLATVTWVAQSDTGALIDGALGV